MRPMGQAVIVAPGRPADVHALVQRPDLKGVLIPREKNEWGPQFAWPGFQKHLDRDFLVPVILSFFDHHKNLVDSERIDIGVPVQSSLGSMFPSIIPIQQMITDRLAVLLADRVTPGEWRLDWDPHTPLPGGVTLGERHPNIDSGPIFSALHRSWHDTIPAGCSPCKDADANVASGELVSA